MSRVSLRWIRSSLPIVCLSLHSACWTSTRDRTGDLRPGDASPIVDTRPACTSDDRVSVGELAVSSTEVDERAAVTITERIRSRCSRQLAGLNVPWRIEVDGTQVAAGTAWIEGGRTIEIPHVWRAVAGSHRVSASANVPDQLGETNLTNNRTAEIVVTVRPATPAPGMPVVVTPLVTERVLTWEEAVAHGARVHNTVERGSACGHIGAFDPAMLNPDLAGASVVFMVECGPIAGGRATAEALDNLSLQNGWRVTRDSLFLVLGDSTNFRWEVKPGERGPDEPYARMRLWSHLISGPPGIQQWLHAYLFVFIAGPVGTSPF